MSGPNPAEETAMTTKTKPTRLAPSGDMVIAPPPLSSGDRLTRPEFERRYEAMPEIKKAELVEGVVYVASPVRFKNHAKPHAQIIGWLLNYSAATLGVEIGDNPTLRMDVDNEPQPDAVLLLDPELGGRARLSEDDYVEGAPELIIEIAASSAAYDLHDKKRAYRRNGVQEYVVWQIYEKRIDWWELYEGEYLPLDADEAGVIRSKVFPGLWLDTSALVAGKVEQVLATLRNGIEADEHAAFVARLAGSGE
jgi:Uma2 family endonuclease